MDNPILSKLRTAPGEPPTNGIHGIQDRDGFIAESLKLIRKVIAGRGSVARDDIPDIAQEVALRLWKWHTKFKIKSSQMAEGDWSSFTARAAHNEVNRNLSSRTKGVELSFDPVEFESDVISNESTAEILMLVEIVWQGICKLSLYQRQALLFSSVDLVIYLLQFGVEEDALLASLGLSNESWESIATRMPLTDSEIADIASPISGRKSKETTANAVKKARWDARKRLKELMK